MSKLFSLSYDGGSGVSNHCSLKIISFCARPHPKPPDTLRGRENKSAADRREEPRWKRGEPRRSVAEALGRGRGERTKVSEFHPSPAVDPDHEVCRDDGGRGCPAPCAGRAQPRQRRGRGRSRGGVPSGATRREGAEAMARGRSAGIAYPERREAERGSSVAARQRRAYGGLIGSAQRGQSEAAYGGL